MNGISNKVSLTEGNIQNIDDENVTVAVSTDVPKELDKVEKDDKQSFEEFKTLYKDVITMKCKQDFGDCEDQKLWEDAAKELFLQSKNYILDGEEFKSKEDLQEEPEKEKKTENVIVTPQVIKENNENEFDDIKPGDEFVNEAGSKIVMLEPTETDEYNFKIINTNTNEEGTGKFSCTFMRDLLKDNHYKKVKSSELSESINNEPKDKLNATEFVSLVDNLKKLDLWDGKDETFKDAVEKYYSILDTQSKLKNEGTILSEEQLKEEDEIEQIQQRIKEINKQLAYIRRRDAVSLSIGSENEKFDLYSERGKLNARLKKLKNKKTESKDNEGSEYDYMLLSRLKSDCEYFLKAGNRAEKHLWAGNVDDQIAKMKELWNSLEEKPEWLSMEDIENYEKEMKQDTVEESKIEEIKTTSENTETYDAIDYFWQDEDIKTIQELIGEAANVSIDEKDKAVLNIKAPQTKYINGGIINGSDVLIDAITEYVHKQYPELEIKVINSGTTFILQDKVTWKSKKDITEESKKIQESQVIEESMPDDWYSEMFNKYVPKDGEADTTGGEILRLFSSISHMFFQNGDKIWRGNFANNSQVLDPKADKLHDLLPQEGKDLMEKMASSTTSSAYEKRLNKLEDYIYNYLKNNNNLFESKLQETYDISYHLAEYDKVLRNDNDTYCVKVENRTTQTETKWLLVDKAYVEKMKELENNYKQEESKLNESKLSDEEIQILRKRMTDTVKQHQKFNNEEDLEKYIDEFMPMWIEMQQNLGTHLTEESIEEKTTLEEGAKEDLGIEPGSDEEAKLNELQDRNFKEEFNVMSKKDKEKYKELIPVNKAGLSSKQCKELAAKYNLDADMLYWVANIGDKVEEGLNEEKTTLEEDKFFNLYQSFNNLYGINKMNPNELIEFINDLKKMNRISDKDFNVMNDYANKWQDLINKTGYESNIVNESKEVKTEDQYEAERRKGRPNLDKIAKEVFEYDDYYINVVDNYKDEWDFVKDNVAEVAAEYNLREQAAEAVMRKIYKMAKESSEKSSE